MESNVSQQIYSYTAPTTVQARHQHKVIWRYKSPVTIGILGLNAQTLTV